MNILKEDFKMANNLNVTEILYGDKKAIRVLGASSKNTNTVGPAGLGRYTARPTSAKGNSKFSGAAYVLDRIILDKAVNALEFDPSSRCNMVYVEFTGADGTLYQATYEDNNEISYANTEAATGYDALIPLVMFALSGNSNATETKERFQKVLKEFNSEGAATVDSVLGFCDCFYYEFLYKNKIEEVTVYDDDLATQTTTQAYESGFADELDLLVPIAGKPFLKALEGVTLRTKKTATATAVSSDMESCMAGSHVIPYEWKESQLCKIPSKDTLSDFIPSDAFYSILKKIENRLGAVLNRWDTVKDDESMSDDQKRLAAIAKDYINLFIVGKPGTGKTTAAYALGAATGMPVYTVAITKNTEEDTFQGMTKVVDGNFSFVSTDFLDAYTNGGIIILEEVNLADPAVIMGALGQAVEAPFILLKDGYEVVRRHPMCVIISTMNIGTNGAKSVSQAFSSRFKQTYILDDPKEEDFISILAKQGHDNKRCKWVYDAYTRINTYLKSPEVNAEDVCLNVTLRGCIGALENWSEGDSAKDALCNTLVGKIAEVDLELANNVKKDVISGMPNPR